MQHLFKLLCVIALNQFFRLQPGNVATCCTLVAPLFFLQGCNKLPLCGAAFRCVAPVAPLFVCFLFSFDIFISEIYKRDYINENADRLKHRFDVVATPHPVRATDRFAGVVSMRQRLSNFHF